MLDFGRTFSYITADPEWIKKLAIGLLVGLVGSFVAGLGAVVLLGYQVAIIRAKLQGQQPELPEWNDWIGFLKDGLFALLISLGYLAPVILLVICMQVVSIGAGAAASGLDADMAGIAATLIGLISLCIGLVIFLYALLATMVMPVALTRFAAQGSIGAAFAVGEVFATLRANVVGWLIVGLVYNGIILPVLVVLGTLLCGLGTYGGLTFGYMASADAMVQAYRGSGAASGD